MLRKITKLLPQIVLTIAVLTSVNAASASEEAAKQFVENIGNKTLKVIQNNGYSEQQKETKLVGIFTSTLDINWIGKFAVGRNWRRLSKDQKRQYQSLYKDFLISSYVPRFRDYTDETFEVLEVRQDRENEYFVQTKIIRSGGKPSTPVDYRVRKYGKNSYKVFDIIAEGVSLISTQRADFGAAIQEAGFDAFLDRLRKRTQELKAAGPDGQSIESKI